MTGLSSAFRKRKALIGYITTGYPSIDVTLQAVPALAEHGCDIIELGIPFSDPLADGATIQHASSHALMNGITPEVCLETAGLLSTRTSVPLVFMTYYNPVLSYGVDRFCRDCAAAGVRGLIVPDLPPEEGGDLEAAAFICGLDLVYLLSPTSDDDRIDLVAEHSHGFIYIVSVTGVTGARQDLPESLPAFVQRVRRRTASPLGIGFGISTPEQARSIAAMADGVIVGSRLIQLMENGSKAGLTAFVDSLRAAVDSATPSQTQSTSIQAGQHGTGSS